MKFGRTTKRDAAGRIDPLVTVAMRVIRRDADGNVLSVEDNGVIRSGRFAEICGSVKTHEDGRREWKLPRLFVALASCALLLAGLVFGHMEVAISATVLTTAGEEWLVNKINEILATKPEYVDWGSGAGTAAKADTTTFTVLPEARVLGTSSIVGTGAAAVYQLVATLTSAAGTAGVTNVSFWTASSGGTLVIHADHASTPLNANDQIMYTLTIDPS